MHEAIAALDVHEVHGSQHVAGGGEVDLDGVIHAAAAMHLHVAAVRVRGEDPRGFPLAGGLAAFVRELMPVPAIAPIDAAVGTEEAAVDVGRIAGKAEL